MPRDGSPQIPVGVTPAEPMTIGEVSNPPFAIVPDPRSLFKRRAGRFASLAKDHALAPYLILLSALSQAQHDASAAAGVPALPEPERVAVALANGMPPLSPGQITLGKDAETIFLDLLARLATYEVNAETRSAIAHIETSPADERIGMMEAILADSIPEGRVAEHVLAAAAVQVYFSGLARQLDAEELKPVADGACPACGGAPVASMIVGWPGMHGARFCTCSICATQWNVSRIKCLVCGSEKGIAYHSIEGGDGHVAGETCEECSSYVKMLHQHKTPEFDPVADDVATLALDVTLEREGWQRASANPFLIGC